MPQILAIGEAQHLRMPLRIAGGAGYHHTLFPDLQSFELSQQREVDWIFLHLEALKPPLISSIREINLRFPKTSILLLLSGESPEVLPQLMPETWFKFLLAIEAPWFKELLLALLADTQGQRFMGLNSLLPWGAQLHSRRTRSSELRKNLLEEMDRYVEGLGLGERLRAHIQSLADEMLMNALYDAPTNEQGRSRYARLDRNVPVELKRQEEVLLRYGCDGRTFGLSVTDPFGRLHPNILKAYVAKGMRKRANQMDRKPGGAGLGLYLLFSGVGSLILDVRAGRSTEIIGLLDVEGSVRVVLKTPKSFIALLRS